jgi:1-acyl-sn-glycerol-3-phosphate acyltransferase
MFYYILRSIVLFLSKILLRRRVRGLSNVPKHSACIVVANHVNLLDSPLLGISLGRKVYFMAKEELFESDLMAWAANNFGAFPVAKGKLDRRAGRKALELLGRGQAIVILPEGKRSEDGKLGQAYPGAALLAVRSNLPIVPVGIIGTNSLTGKGWYLKRPRIELNIGCPFTLSAHNGKLSKEEITDLTNEVMTHIAELLPPELRGRYENQIKDRQILS